MCQNCGTPGAAWKGQAVRRGELLWEINFQCLNCGLTSCDFDPGEAPAHIRDALLATHGPARLRVEDPKGRIKLLQVLRSTFGWPLDRARRALAELGTTGYRCTDVEAEFLRRRLTELGVHALVEK
ncbi:hypothetical protein ACFQ0M_08615 [Kitasatospora aburaviensis]